jgi:hypothetical protein
MDCQQGFSSVVIEPDTISRRLLLAQNPLFIQVLQCELSDPRLLQEVRSWQAEPMPDSSNLTIWPNKVILLQSKFVIPVLAINITRMLHLLSFGTKVNLIQGTLALGDLPRIHLDSPERTQSRGEMGVDLVLRTLSELGWHLRALPSYSSSPNRALMGLGHDWSSGEGAR